MLSKAAFIWQKYSKNWIEFIPVIAPVFSHVILQ